MTLKKHLTFIVAAVCCVSIASAQTSDRDHLRSNVLG